jgi:hypothetical protein
MKKTLIAVAALIVTSLQAGSRSPPLLPARSVRTKVPFELFAAHRPAMGPLASW